MLSLKVSRNARGPGAVGLAAFYTVFVAVVARTLTSQETSAFLPRYLWLELVFLLLATAAWWLPRLRLAVYLYFSIQTAVVLVLVSINPVFDFVVLLFFLLSYQAALTFSGVERWISTIVFVLLTGGSLSFYLGFVRSMSVALTTIAAEVVVTAYVIVLEEIEAAGARSRILLEELTESHQKLELYAGQIEELAAARERNRLSRALHDKVSQLIFGISLAARSIELFLNKDPSRLQHEIVRLQELNTEALHQLRDLITELRQPENTSGDSA
jgi:signal transduction histidine kinase